MSDVDLRCLIRAVRKRPVIWNKHHPCYKDRSNTKKAWMEIFIELNDGFELMDQRTRMEYGHSLMKKWSNIRDSFQRSERKMRDFVKYGAKQRPKTYIYSHDLQFLKKAKHRRTVPEEFDDGAALQGHLEHVQEDETSTTHNAAEPDVKDESQHFAEPIREQERHHVSFLSGISPTLGSFDEDEMLEFQLVVLQKIADMKRRKKNLGCVRMAGNPIASYGSDEFPTGSSVNFRGLHYSGTATVQGDPGPSTSQRPNENIGRASRNLLQVASSSETDPRTSTEPPEDFQRNKRPLSTSPPEVTPPERQIPIPPPTRTFQEPTRRSTPQPTWYPPQTSSGCQYQDEFFTFGQHVANQLRCLPLGNAIVCQNYINNYLAEERLKVINEGGGYYRHDAVPTTSRCVADDRNVGTVDYHHHASATASNSSMEPMEDFMDDFSSDQKLDFIKVEDNSDDLL
ncbi:uncharacterized protein LOC123318839 [Coccinella septempunctata]|uniref:uncharacterized protein LOC123318839 n=1 Tax=Coccinella septempunctata TaxID=41139 RepID=UPI001D09853F|nr:uncharacterized protein LOC123318839 [Coccinella septempunctata]